MKKVLSFVLTCISFSFQAQIYQSYNINFLSLSTPNNDTSGVDNRKYSGCWGWYQTSKNKEYGISGTSNGTYFIDVTSPTNPVVCDFVPGKKKATYREIKTYQNYCYIVSDDAPTNKFQIVDLQYLPDSVHVVHNSDSIFPRGHTIWIDQDKLYVGAVTYTNGFSAMNVYSLANPKLPLLLKKLQQDIPFINYVHDMYVRNDTVYASCADQGLYVFKFLSSTNTFTQLGSYTGYPSHGYNHSSALTKDGKHLLFCDEVPTGLPIHFVNVENLGNIQPVIDFYPAAQTTPHNPFVKDEFMIVSCYQDGLYIYDVSQPSNINLTGYFDTHPQGGANVNNYGSSGYRGNWGAYPFLPSGNIIANDMQNGMFVLNASAAYSTSIQNPVQVSEITSSQNNLFFYPNPSSSYINVHSTTSQKSALKILNNLGQIVFEKEYHTAINDQISVINLPNGVYQMNLTSEKSELIKKLIICH